MASVLRSGLNLRPVARLHAARSFSTAPLRRAEQPYFTNEPKAPVVQTAIPGPKNKAAAADLDEVFDSRSLNLLGDYSKSVGN
jgi:4-aminobutyrate aminotransferase/(S)-3-amino-2-methylpropionate transaminase